MTLNSIPAQSTGMSFPQAPQMAPNDRDALIRTIAGEAGGEGPQGQAALAHVVMNRLAAGGYGDTVKDIVQASAAGVNPARGYHEFSTWNPPARGGNSIPQNMSSSDPAYTKIGDIVDQVYNGSIPDPTGGATHYFAPKSMQGGQPPPWAGPLAAQNQVRIGDQVFVGGSTGPGQQVPSQIAGGPYDVGQMGA
jgi:conjugal transfer mating pair stabilization protein TraG